MLALEPRIMFDAAAATTAVHIAVDAPALAEHLAEAPAPASDSAVAPATPAASVTAAGRAPHEVVFISGQVDDLDTLLAGLKPGVERVMLDSRSDGLTQIAQYLAEHSGTTAVHLVTHGRAGSVELGNVWLTRDNLDAHADTLARIGSSLAPGADLLIYGCNVGAGDAGAAFLDQLAQATGADVAASGDATGAARFGGDWVLEAQRGSVTTSVAFSIPTLASYSGLLAVADENFDNAGLLIQTSTSTFTLPSGWTFTSNVPSGFATADSSDQASNLNLDGGVGDRALLLNFDGQAATDFSFKFGGTNFDLNSFKLGSLPGGSDNLTITGWRDGAMGVFGESVNLAASDSAGNIAYTLLGSTAGGNYGLLTFGSAFDNVDEIRMSFSFVSSPEIDDIDVSPALVPPTATVVVSDNALRVGETSLVTFTFSEAVTGFTNADLSIANGTLSAV
ncbi:DUF4347 domain-containing protein, partial [Nostoc sp. NIES-2111]